MSTERLTSVVRVLVFYFTALVLLVVLGSLLQYQLGLPGVVVTHLMIFFSLPLLFTVVAERKPLKPFLRLRMLSAKGFGKAIFLGLAGWFMAQIMGSVVVLILHQLGGELVQPYQILLDAPAWLALIAGALIPAITEELSFRGYVLGALRPLGPTAAVLLTGLLFGALHLSLIRLVPLTLLGILWSLAVQRSGSILPGMIMHLFNNGIALGLTFFVQGQANPAALETLNGFPPIIMWGVIGIMGAMSLGFGAVAYFVSASFNPTDLAQPDEAIEGEEALRPAQPEPAAVAFANPEEVPAEVRSLESELAGLRQRRRRMLQATGLITGLLIAAIYLYAVWQELISTFR